MYGGNEETSSASVGAAPFWERVVLKATTNQSRWLAGNYRKSPAFSLLASQPACSLSVWSVGIKRGARCSACGIRNWNQPNDFNLCHLSPVIILSGTRSNPFHPLHQLLSMRCLVSLLEWLDILLNVPICCPAKGEISWDARIDTALMSLLQPRRSNQPESLKNATTVCCSQLTQQLVHLFVCVFQICKVAECKQNVCLLWGSPVRGDFLESRF